MIERKWLPTLGELLDRISIVTLKATFDIENKEKWEAEIADLVHDAQLILGEKQPQLTADFLRAVVVLATFNTLIWENEKHQRSDNPDGNNLIFTHQANGTRSRSRDIISKKVKNRTDQKVDAGLASNLPPFEPKW